MPNPEQNKREEFMKKWMSVGKKIIKDNKFDSKDDWPFVFEDAWHTAGFTAFDLVSQTRRETIEEMIKLSDEVELREPDGGTEQWMAFKAFRNKMRDKLNAPKD